jgi:hypothetical protein
VYACWHVLLEEASSIKATGELWHSGSLETDDLVYVIRADPSSKPVTALSAARFLKTLDGDEGHAGAAPSRHTPAQMKKFFEMTHGAHRVRVLTCSGDEKGNLFLKRVNMDVDLAIEGEVVDDGVVLFLECDCEGLSRRTICVSMLSWWLRTLACVTSRRSRGRVVRGDRDPAVNAHRRKHSARTLVSVASRARTRRSIGSVNF